ncbi:MAG TPA: aminotransferase class III-fold pyridoxal phosphate-dependent enzyme [Anaerolineales bacterium]|nr:aminotransferase class III-fold pyridoxal phosphate-dependent enzyme [Anaerolineales bacterium]
MFESTLTHVSPVWNRNTNIIIDHARGAYVYDLSGLKYLDFTSGIGVTSTGHCHPKVVAAIQEQAGRLLHAQANIYFHRPLLELIDTLLPLVPDGMDSFYFTNSGAECLEGAVKLAKHATGRTNVIVFSGGFHGRTHLTMTMSTSKVSLRKFYQPLVSGIFVAPYPYAYYFGWDDDTTTDFCLKELKKMFKGQTSPEEVAAIIIEPVLGEGGYVVPPSRFLQELRNICDHYGILFIVDEVQSGFGRTGKFFAIENHGIVPDVMTVAKGIASGVPLSGVITRGDIAAKWLPGSHGGTYGGNALACAAAKATVEVIIEEELVRNAAERGEQLRARLRNTQKRFSVMGDVRGIGLMDAVEFTRDGEPDAMTCQAVKSGCLERGLIILSCGPFDNVVRWIPPLIVTEDQIEEAVRIFDDALEEVN